MSDADSVEEPDTAEPTVKNIQIEVEWQKFPFIEKQAVEAVTAELRHIFPEYEVHFQHATAVSPEGLKPTVKLHVSLTHKEVKHNLFGSQIGVESFLPRGPVVSGSLTPELQVGVGPLPAPEPSPFDLLKEEMLDRGHLRPEELSRNV